MATRYSSRYINIATMIFPFWPKASSPIPG
uniref:Uncharacterized protein n=1 Tax=Arundo donax TaxID=35708 RepID=A0A0A9ELN5_ARUDO